ncbi:transmembrane protein [Cavenderia fasciculata]|uniref:Transmembrane protein n=1 Tax=Cavenderia fasciculata TaxID=261658 RepID=F4QF80_CACFS|nr:uncharacterized protein DFA_12004 [Cavenderia fasciculata]EGG14234.1 transmembrane protein [Cavenderia fasciculata]|eukprot:XP_004350943.1 transmembrane protein [Cavenderia fasciculata]
MTNLSKSVIVSMNSYTETLVKLFAQTSGKDKLAKILQYGAKLFGYIALRQKNKHWMEVMKKLETSSGSARKVWRLGNTMQEQQKILQMLRQGNCHQFLNMLALIRQLGMYFYWVFDNLIWSTNIGFTKLDTARLGWYSSISWLFGLVSSIIIDMNALSVTLRKEKQLIKDGVDINSDQYVAVLKKKHELYLNCFKNGADSVIAANLLKIYQTNQGTVGTCGLISAFIGAYQMISVQK